MKAMYGRMTPRARKTRKTYPKSTGAQRGFTIVDCLILLLILGIAIGAIVTTVFWASDLGSFNRATLGMRTAAVSVFEVLEAMPPVSLDSDFNATLAAVITSLGGSGSRLAGYSITASAQPAANGMRSVKLTISLPSSKKVPYTLERFINTMSEETTDDVVDG